MADAVCRDEEMVLGRVVINEILSHSDAPYEDAVELYNPGSQSVCLEDWFLTDDLDEPRKYRIAEGTRIGPGEYLVFFAQQFNSKPGGEGSFGLSEHGEEIYLIAASKNGEFGGYRDGGSFSASPVNQTLGRYEASDGVVFIPMERPTFGQENPGSVEQFRQNSGGANAPPLVGPIVISEILFEPAGDRSEYLILSNISDRDVALYYPGNWAIAWQFTDGIRYQFPENTVIAPGQSVYVVEMDPETFREQYALSQDTVIFGPYEGKLSNEGERITLSRPDHFDQEEGVHPYVVADTLAFGTEAPWPEVEANLGTAIMRRDLTDVGDDPENWRPKP